MEPDRLRLAHRISGIILGIFLLAHMANNLAALAGVAAHRQILEALRTVYRFPPAEALLLACVLVQALSGIRLALRGWRKQASLVERAQYLSGAYLAFFLGMHVGAVMVARGVLGIDTDFSFATAGIHVYPYAFFFIPYYFLAVASLGIHLACALLPKAGMPVATTIAGGGVAAAMLMVAALSTRPAAA